MEFLPVYLLVLGTFFGLFAIAFTAIATKKNTLNPGEENIIQKYLTRKQHELDRSRSNLSLQEYFAIMIGCPAGLTVIAYFLSTDRTLMIVFAVFGLFLPGLFISARKKNEDTKFTDRYVRALTQMASSLHAGMTVEQAVDSVVDCELLHQSVREDFKILSAKLKLGTPIAKAFYEFAEVTENRDAYDTAVAIDIMLNVGGDAGTAIAKIQKNIEERLLYRKKRESILAESNMMALFCDIVPILTIGLMYVLVPSLMSYYFESTTGMIIFGGLIVMMLLGTVVIRRMLRQNTDL